MEKIAMQRSPNQSLPRTSRALEVEFLGRSDAFLACSEELARIAAIDRSVLLIGERGTGKELAAARLHYLSPRWQGPFVTLNCAALAPSLIESELFGHEAGAFTGAVGRRIGRFEAANGGTLFLDEIASMPLEAQEKILRVVEYGEFERVGGITPVTADTRILGAANADLPELASQGRFKKDLLDRLSFEVLTLPPLRARGEDILLLAEHFASRMAQELGFAEPVAFSSHVLEQLQNHGWPGNVRELKNVVERSVARCLARDGACARNGKVERLVFDAFASPYRPHSQASALREQAPPTSSEASSRRLGDGYSLPLAVADLERSALSRALEQSRFKQKEAARLLGLSYHQFRSLYRKHRGPHSGEERA
jgi:psp operon transcriptional activator